MLLSGVPNTGRLWKVSFAVIGDWASQTSGWSDFFGAGAADRRSILASTVARLWSLFDLAELETESLVSGDTAL